MFWILVADVGEEEIKALGKVVKQGAGIAVLVIFRDRELLLPRFGTATAMEDYLHNADGGAYWKTIGQCRYSILVLVCEACEITIRA